MHDFTIASYQSLLTSFLGQGYEFPGLEDFIGSSTGKAVFLRHDIDRYTSRVATFAKLENSLGIRATWYFRPPHTPAHEEMIRTVVSNHHHLGYHYNDLAEHHGNVPVALECFSETLARLRTFADVKSVCMHGNVFSSVNNLDLARHIGFKELGLTGDPYLVIDHHRVLYLTDTGRCWNCSRYNKWDRVKSTLSYHPPSTAAMMADLAAGRLPDRLHLCVHPQHYYSNMLQWAAYYLRQSARNRVKTLFIKPDHA
jgi:hypothetical protein